MFPGCNEREFVRKLSKSFGSSWISVLTEFVLTSKTRLCQDYGEQNNNFGRHKRNCLSLKFASSSNAQWLYLSLWDSEKDMANFSLLLSLCRYHQFLSHLVTMSIRLALVFLSKLLKDGYHCYAIFMNNWGFLKVFSPIGCQKKFLANTKWNYFMTLYFAYSDSS